MLVTILVIRSSERWAGGKTPRTVQYSTVVDRHGDQGRHVLGPMSNSASESTFPFTTTTSALNRD